MKINFKSIFSVKLNPKPDHFSSSTPLAEKTKIVAREVASARVGVGLSLLFMVSIVMTALFLPFGNGSFFQRQFQQRESSAATPPAITFSLATTCVNNVPSTVIFSWARSQSGYNYELYWTGSGGSISVGDVGQTSPLTGFSPGTVTWNVRAFNPTTLEAGPYKSDTFTVPSSCTTVTPTLSTTPTPTSTPTSTNTPTPTDTSGTTCVFNQSNTVSVTGGVTKSISITATNLSRSTYVGWTSNNIDKLLYQANNSIAFNSTMTMTTTSSSYTGLSSGVSRTFTFNINTQATTPTGSYELQALFLSRNGVKTQCTYQGIGGLVINVSGSGGTVTSTPSPTPTSGGGVGTPDAGWAYLGVGNSTYSGTKSWTTIGALPTGVSKLAFAVWAGESENRDVTGNEQNYSVTLGSTSCTRSNSPWSSVEGECVIMPNLTTDFTYNDNYPTSSITECDFRYLASTRQVQYQDSSTAEDCAFAVFYPTTSTPTPTSTPTLTAGSAVCSANTTSINITKGGTGSVTVTYSTTGNSKWAPGFRATNGVLNSVGPNNERALMGGGQSGLTVSPSTAARIQAPNNSTVNFQFYIDNVADVQAPGTYTFSNLVLINANFANTVVNCTTTFTINVVPTTVTIQGRHVDQNGNNLAVSGQKVTLSNGSTTTLSPTWFINNLTAGTYTVTAASVAGYNISVAKVVTAPLASCSLPSTTTYISGSSTSVSLPAAGYCADVYFKYTPTTTPSPTPNHTATCNIQGDSGFEIMQGAQSTITIPASILNGTGGGWAPAVRFVNPVNSTTGERRQAVGTAGERVPIGNGLTVGATPARFTFPYDGDLVFTFYASDTATPNDYLISNLLLVYEPTNALTKDANCTGSLSIVVKAKPTPTPTASPTSGGITPSTTPAPTATTGVTIQGHHIDQNGNDLSASYTTVSLLQLTNCFAACVEVPNTSSPFFQYKNIAPATYSIKAAGGYSISVSYAKCINSNCSPSSTFTTGTTLVIDLPQVGNYADIYFKYAVVGSGTPPAPTPTPTIDPSIVRPSGMAVVDSKCSSTTKADVTFVWYHPTATAFKIGWRVKSTDPEPVLFPAVGAQPEAVQGAWKFTYPGFDHKLTLAEWKLAATVGTSEGPAQPSNGTFTTADCTNFTGPTPDPTLTKPDDVRVIESKCVGRNNTQVTFRWHHPNTSTSTFQIGWDTQLRVPDFFTPTGVVGEGGGWFSLKQQGFNTYGQPIVIWGVRAVYGTAFSEGKYGQQFIPTDCSNYDDGIVTPGTPGFAECCESPTYGPNPQFTSHLENLDNFMSGSLAEIDAQFTIVAGNPLSYLNIFNVTSISTQLFASKSASDIRFDKLAYARLYTLTQTGYSVNDILNWYRTKLDPNRRYVTSKELFYYLDSKFAFGGYRKWFDCIEQNKSQSETYRIQACASVSPGNNPKFSHVGSGMLLDTYLQNSGAYISKFIVGDEGLIARVIAEEQTVLRFLDAGGGNISSLLNSLVTLDSSTREFVNDNESIAKVHYYLGNRLKGKADSTAAELYLFVAQTLPSNSVSSAAQSQLNSINSWVNKFGLMRPDFIFGIVEPNPLGPAFKVAKLGVVSTKIGRGSFGSYAPKVAAVAGKSESEAQKYLENIDDLKAGRLSGKQKADAEKQVKEFVTGKVTTTSLVSNASYTFTNEALGALVPTTRIIVDDVLSSNSSIWSEVLPKIGVNTSVTEVTIGELGGGVYKDVFVVTLKTSTDTKGFALAVPNGLLPDGVSSLIDVSEFNNLKLLGANEISQKVLTENPITHPVLFGKKTVDTVVLIFEILPGQETFLELKNAPGGYASVGAAVFKSLGELDGKLWQETSQKAGRDYTGLVVGDNHLQNTVTYQSSEGYVSKYIDVGGTDLRAGLVPEKFEEWLRINLTHERFRDLGMKGEYVKDYLEGVWPSLLTEFGSKSEAKRMLIKAADYIEERAPYDLRYEPYYHGVADDIFRFEGSK